MEDGGLVVNVKVKVNGGSKEESGMRNAEKSLSELGASAVKDGPGGAGPYRNFVNVNGGSKAENFVSEVTPR